MNILIFNGSPKKKEHSMTIQTIFSVFKNYPLYNYSYLDISSNIDLIEKNDNYFKNIIQEVLKADLIIWSCPVYVTCIPSQLKRFIEIIIEKNEQKVFEGKYAASFTTSIRFYDHHAHYYLHSICDDFNMKYLGYYSADTEDIFNPSERKKIMEFGEILFGNIEKRLFIGKKHQPIIKNNFIYQPSEISNKIDVGNKNIIIISDYENDNNNLKKMVSKFKDSFNLEIEEINLAKQKILFGCQGCHTCGYDNTCILKDRDDFHKIFTEKLLPADILIFAFNINDRYINSRFKKFFDRCFFMNHVPYFIGKQLGILFSGPGSQIHYLIDNLSAISMFIGTNLADSVGDESSDSKIIDGYIETLAKKIIYFSEKKYILSPTFLKIGGHKIFRDDIWGRYRLTLQADHRYYKKRGFYDFPQKQIKKIDYLKNNILIFLCKFPNLRKKIYFWKIRVFLKKIKKINHV